MDLFILLYIDPGTGSLLLQVIIGGIVTFGLFFKNKLKAIFSIFKKKDSDSNND